MLRLIELIRPQQPARLAFRRALEFSTFRGQRWLLEGIDKVAERDGAGARTLKIVGQASLLPVRCCASFLARAAFESRHRTGHANE